MANWRKSLLLIFFALVSAPGIAQQSEREAERAVEEAVREAEEQQLTVEVQMREAEERLAAAARQIAELSSSQLPAIADIERRAEPDAGIRRRGVLARQVKIDDDLTAANR